MRGMLVIAICMGLGFNLGCNTGPKREMRQQFQEEFSVPPSSYDKVTELPGDNAPLKPRQEFQPGLNTAGAGGVGSPSPSSMPGMRNGR